MRPEKRPTYTCGTDSDVRGNCGHTHRTLAAAAACCQRDQAACERVGGYSDRYPRRTDGRDLNDWEIDTLSGDAHEHAYDQDGARVD